MTRSPARAGGFTLLELLAATAVTAALAGALYASLCVALKARDTVVRNSEMTRTCETAMDVMREDLEAAVASKGELTGTFAGEPDADLGGDNDILDFNALATDPEVDEAMGDVRKIEYASAQADDGKGLVLVRRVWSNLLSETEVNPREETLCRGVRLFSLRYFDGTDWQETWDSTTVSNALPTAVEVTLELGTPGTTAAEEASYRLIRVVSIPCGQGVPAGTTTTSGGSSSGASGSSGRTP